jgi:hypothetical protein
VLAFRTDGSDRMTVNDGTVDVLNGVVRLGAVATTAETGAIRMQSATGVYSRNAADSANLALIATDSSNNLFVGDAANAGLYLNTSGGIVFQTDTATRLTLGDDQLEFASSIRADFAGEIAISRQDTTLIESSGAGLVTLPSGSLSLGASSAAVSASNTARIKYDNTLKKLYVSIDGAAYEQLNNGTALATGTNLTDGNATITVAQRYVLPASTLSTDRTLTITPPATVGAGFLIEVGTQGSGNDYLINNGGPGAGTLYTVVGATRFAVWAVSNGTDMLLSAIMPLGAEP